MKPAHRAWRAGVAALFACSLMAGCTTSNVKRVEAAAFTPPAAGAEVVLVRPDVQLAIQTAVGAEEVRADWSRAGAENLQAGLVRQLEARGYRVRVLDADTNMSGRIGQILRLHEAVAQTIAVHEYMGIRLPSKEGRFDYTLGEGTREVFAGDRDAGYALFVAAQGCYTSAGRVAVMVVAAVANAGVLPSCGQSVMVSLVSTQTGQVVWFNLASAGPADDMRQAGGADALVRAALRSAPLQTPRPAPAVTP